MCPSGLAFLVFLLLTACGGGSGGAAGADGGSGALCRRCQATTPGTQGLGPEAQGDQQLEFGVGLDEGKLRNYVGWRCS
jgi:hypothetical protein